MVATARTLIWRPAAGRGRARSTVLGTRAWPKSLARAVAFLRSREVAVGLLGLIMLAAITGTFVPQRALTARAEYEAWRQSQPVASWLAEVAGLTQVYWSPWFLALLGALFLSLLVCTASRARLVWRMDRSRHRWAQRVPLWVTMPGHHQVLAVADGASDVLRHASAALDTRGYRLRLGRDATVVFAERGRHGVWGSVVLHLGIMVALLGGLYSGAGKMAGYFELAEGQVFVEGNGSFLQVEKGPLYPEPRAGFQVRLDDVRTDYWENGTLRSIASQLTLRSPEGELVTRGASVEQPLAYDGATIYQAKRHGYAARLSLGDPQGSGETTGYVNFALPKELTQPSSNRFPLPGTPLQVQADFYPAPGARPEPETWLRDVPERPWLYLFVHDDADRLVYQGALELGERVSLGAHTLAFAGVARWAGFPVVRDPGLAVVYAGFGLCAAGAAALFLRIPRRLWAWVTVAGDGRRVLRLGGRADKYQLALDDEVGELLAEIGERHGRP